MKTNLLSRIWWKDALIRAIYTAVAIAVPYLGGALLTTVPWPTILLAAALGVVASVATSLAGLPEVSGVTLPWWLAALERVVKTFAQALAAGFVGATLLTDVPWGVVLQAAALSALTSLLRFILSTLPADPTAPSLTTVNHDVAADVIASNTDIVAAARAAASTIDGSGRTADEPNPL